MRPAGPLVLIASMLILLPTRAYTQAASASGGGAQWDILALGGGWVGGNEGGAGAVWEFGAGLQVVSSSRIGGRLVAASQNNDQGRPHSN